jgi:hypothetical protein
VEADCGRWANRENSLTLRVARLDGNFDRQARGVPGGDGIPFQLRRHATVFLVVRR